MLHSQQRGKRLNNPAHQEATLSVTQKQTLEGRPVALASPATCMCLKRSNEHVNFNPHYRIIHKLLKNHSTDTALRLLLQSVKQQGRKTARANDKLLNVNEVAC